MSRALAWLVQNHYVRNEKFRQLGLSLQRAAEAEGLNLQIWGHSQLAAHFPLGLSAEGGAPSWPQGLERPRFVLFWDKDLHLARRLELAGLRLFNTSRAIALCDDKAWTHLELAGSSIPMPETILGPLNFRPETYPVAWAQDYLDLASARLGYPLVLKTCRGSFGQGVYLLQDREELEAQIEKLGKQDFLLQAFVASSRGRDLRLQMVGDQAVAWAARFNGEDFRSNVTNGGRMERTSLHPQALELGRRVMSLLGLDFAGLDLLEDGRGSYLLCEVNSNAHFINLDACCGTDTGQAIMRYCKVQMGIST